MRKDIFYTFEWKVKPGMKEEFIKTWNRLNTIFTNLDQPPVGGTLIQSVTNENLFYSFGLWEKSEHIEAIQKDQVSRRLFKQIIDLCEEAKPRSYKLIRNIKL